jgi:hypothetical protein
MLFPQKRPQRYTQIICISKRGLIFFKKSFGVGVPADYAEGAESAVLIPYPAVFFEASDRAIQKKSFDNELLK